MADVTVLLALQLGYVGHEQGYLHRLHLEPPTVSWAAYLRHATARTRSRISKSLRSLMNMLPALIGPTVCELLGPTGKGTSCQGTGISNRTDRNTDLQC